MKLQRSSKHVHTPFGPYSIAIEKNGVLHVSGQGPFDKEKRLNGDEIIQQAKQTMDNLRHIIVDNGYQMDEIVKVTVYLQNISDWSAFNEVYATYFSDPMPARTVVACQLNGMLVEVDCVAMH